MAFRFFRRREAEADNREQILGESDTLSDILLTSIMNGESLTREQALSIPGVSGNVDFISSAIASMPIKLYKRDANGIVSEIEKDTRIALLNSDTGDTLDAFQFKKAMVEDYLLGKGGYAYIEKYRNEFTGLYYVEDDFVVIDYNFEPIRKSYRIYVEDGIYKPFEFIKLLRNTKNGAWGQGIIEELSAALQVAYQTQLYQLGLVKRGGNKKGFLKSERRLGKDEIAALKLAWRNLYGNNEENVVVLNNGLDFKESTNTSVEMQLNESIDTLGNQIDKIFHIYPDFYNTFKFSIYPIVKAFETALNRDFLLEKEKGKKFFEFDVKEIIRANIKERFEVYRIAKECGFMTKNEMRQAENMNEIEGLDVVDLGLGAALYDVNTHTYYTPNTDTQSELKTLEEESIIDHDNGSERDEIRYNKNHGKDGRFTTGGGGSASGGSSSKKTSSAGGDNNNSVKNDFADSEEKRLDELSGGKLGAELNKTGMYSREDLLAATKNGNLDDYKNDYIQTLRENGDVTIKGDKTTDNNANFNKTPRESMRDEVTESALSNGMSQNDIDKMYDETSLYFSNEWNKANSDYVDKFVDNTPTFDGKIERGLHFDTPEEYNEFMDGIEKGSIIGSNGKNTSWTSSNDVSRRYAHMGDDNVNSVMLVCDKNVSSSAVNKFSNHPDEFEVLARSNAQWTVTRVDTQTLDNGTKKAVVHVIERTADNE